MHPTVFGWRSTHPFALLLPLGFTNAVHLLCAFTGLVTSYIAIPSHHIATSSSCLTGIHLLSSLSRQVRVDCPWDSVIVIDLGRRNVPCSCLRKVHACPRWLVLVSTSQFRPGRVR